MAETTYLPDKPNIYSDLNADGYQQRWLPGAFGDRDDISDVVRFQVLEDDWQQDAEGNAFRTITKATIFETVHGRPKGKQMNAEAQKAAQKAFEVLAEIAMDEAPTTRDETRIRAACAILDRLDKVPEENA